MLDSSILKYLEGNNSNILLMIIVFVPEWVENIVGKGENVG